jgi:hypothetical protein
MSDILSLSEQLLSEVGFTTGRLSTHGREALVFEDPTVLGFLVLYGTSSELIGKWASDVSTLIAEQQFGLRRAGPKAWNVYTVFLATRDDEPNSLAMLAAIEEDLAGTRKIARAPVKDPADLRAALLTLLPLQAAPHLEAVDMQSEIRQRATDVPTRAVEAFLSTSDEAAVIQVLEEAS